MNKLKNRFREDVEEKSLREADPFSDPEFCKGYEEYLLRTAVENSKHDKVKHEPR